MLMIYAKSEDMPKFRPMDMNNGTVVNNKIFATMYDDYFKEKLIAWCKELESENKGWKFEVRKA